MPKYVLPTPQERSMSDIQNVLAQTGVIQQTNNFTPTPLPQFDYLAQAEAANKQAQEFRRQAIANRSQIGPLSGVRPPGEVTFSLGGQAGAFGARYGHNYTRVPYMGVTLDARTRRMIRAANRIYGGRLDPSQGSYSNSVAASAGTHAGGGVLDIIQGASPRMVRALNRAGFKAFLRTPSQGPWPLHVHAVDIWNKRLSPQALRQVQGIRARQRRRFNAAGGGGGGGGAPSRNVGMRQYARQLLNQRGWGGQWGDFNKLIQHESSWRPKAQNPSSSAYGLGQFLDQTWGSVGGKKTSDPYRQLELIMKYINRRYGNASNAWDFWQRNHYY